MPRDIKPVQINVSITTATQNNNLATCKVYGVFLNDNLIDIIRQCLGQAYIIRVVVTTVYL